MDILVTVRPYEGTYPFVEIDEWTRGEWRIVRNLTGYMPVTFFDGLKGGDPDTTGAMAVVAMLRAGKIGEDDVPTVWDRLSAADAYESVSIEGAEETEEGDAGPPEIRDDSSSTSSGPDTQNSSPETLPMTPPGTGTHSSDTSVFDLETLRA